MFSSCCSQGGWPISASAFLSFYGLRWEQEVLDIDF